MKAAVLHGPNDLRIEERPRPRPGPGQVLVQVRASGVCNSDLHRVAAADVPKLPLVIGHEFAGRVAETGPGAQVAVGARVAVHPLLPCGRCPCCRRKLYECCAAYSYHGSRTDGGFAEFVLTRPENLVPAPAGVSDEEAAMSEPAAVGLHALNRAGLQEHETVVVIGAGTIGLIAAQVARAGGAGQVAILDVLDEPLAFARKLGFEHALRSDAPDLLDRIRAVAGDSGPDVVLEAAGSPVTYNLAVDLAAPGGRVVFMGNISGDLTLPQKRVSSILRKQLTILGAWNSSLVQPENEWAAIHDLVARKEIDLRSLISHRITLDQLPDAIRRMQERREPYRKVMVLF
jgi:L-iditol 2-dehydrogenase